MKELEQLLTKNKMFVIINLILVFFWINTLIYIFIPNLLRLINYYILVWLFMVTVFLNIFYNKSIYWYQYIMTYYKQVFLNINFSWGFDVLTLNLILLSSFLLLICYLSYCNLKYDLLYYIWSFDTLALNRIFRRYIKIKFLNSLGTPRKPVKTYQKNLDDYTLVGKRYGDKYKIIDYYDKNNDKIWADYNNGHITWDQARASYLINKHSSIVMDHPTIAWVNKNNPDEVICATETSKENAKHGTIYDMGVDSNNKPVLGGSLYGVVCKSIEDWKNIMKLPHKYTSIMKERDNIITTYWKNKNNINGGNSNIQNFQVFLYTPDVLLEAHMSNLEKGLTPEILKEQIKNNPDPITNMPRISSTEDKNNQDDNEHN